MQISCRNDCKHNLHGLPLQHLKKVGRWEKTKGGQRLYCHVKKQLFKLVHGFSPDALQDCSGSRQLMKTSERPKRHGTSSNVLFYFFNLQSSPLSCNNWRCTFSLWMMDGCNIWGNLAVLGVFAYFAPFKLPIRVALTVAIKIKPKTTKHGFNSEITLKRKPLFSLIPVGDILRITVSWDDCSYSQTGPLQRRCNMYLWKPLPESSNHFQHFACDADLFLYANVPQTQIGHLT